MQKQLRHLERQSATAQKYKAFREEERRVRAELLVLRLDNMLDDVEKRDRTIAEQENRLQSSIAEQRNVESRIEEQRAAHTEANDEFNEVQGRFYAIGSEIARLERPSSTRARRVVNKRPISNRRASRCSRRAA